MIVISCLVHKSKMQARELLLMWMCRSYYIQRNLYTQNNEKQWQLLSMPNKEKEKLWMWINFNIFTFFLLVFPFRLFHHASCTYFALKWKASVKKMINAATNKFIFLIYSFDVLAHKFMCDCRMWCYPFCLYRSFVKIFLHNCIFSTC